MKRLLCLLLFPVSLFAATFSGWIGTYTTDETIITGSEGIYSFQWNSETGTLGSIKLAAMTTNPSFLALHPNGRYMYAVNEDVAPSGIDRISAFAIDNPSASGSLQWLGSVSSQGSAPCHLSIDATGKWLFVANYLSGTIAVYPIQPDGRLGEAKQIIKQTGSGPVAVLQDSAHTHQVLQSPDGRYLLSVDLGADKVFVYRFDAITGALTPNKPAFVAIPAGYGPRHLVFSKDAHLVYLMTELNPAVITLRWNAERGTLTQLAVTPALPADFRGVKSGAEIMLHPGGRFLYVSNRGDSDTIAIFRIGADGLPQLAGQVPSGGKKPRFFGIDPTGRYLITAHQATGDLFVFGIDPDTGSLQALGSRFAVPSPVMILFGAATNQ